MFIYLHYPNESSGKGVPLKNQIGISDSDFRKFFEASVDILCVTDPQFILLKSNKGFENLFGCGANDLSGRSLLEFVHPDDKERTSEVIKSTGSNFPVKGFVTRVRAKSGEYKFLEWNFIPVGNLYYNSARDISVRIEAERAVTESEMRYRFLAEHSTDIIWSLDPETFKFTYVSPSVEKVFGYTVEEMKSIKMEDFMMPESLPVVVESTQRLLKEFREKGTAQPQLNVNKLIRKDGSSYWSEDVTSVQLNAEGKLEMIGVSRNVDDRVEAETKLRERERTYRFLYENMDDVVWLLDIETMKFTYVSASSAKHRGYTPEEIINMGIENSVSSSSLPLVIQKIESLIQRFNETGENASEKLVVQQGTKDGGFVWSEISGTIHRDQNGRLAIVGVARNISDKIEAEGKIKAFEERLRFIYENSIDVLWQLDAENRKIAFITPSIEKLTGYTLDEFTSMNFDSYFTEESLPLAKQKVFEYVKSTRQNGKSGPERILLHQNTKAGGSVAVEMVIFGHLTNEGKVEISGISRDVTERYEAEKLIQKQNAELSGLLSERDKLFSIIAHDLRSPFHGLLGFAELFGNAINEGDVTTVLELGEKFHPLVKNLYNLVEELLEWAMLQQKAITYVPLNISVKSVVTKVISLFEAAIREKELIIQNNIPNSLLAFADEKMLNAILRNLISNAIKFTPAGGEIKITATVNKGKIEISVSDTGIGIPPTIANNLFSLGKTTKRKGTAGELSAGLGLILTKEYAEKNGGTLRFETEVNKGTTFYFTLPAAM